MKKMIRIYDSVLLGKNFLSFSADAIVVRDYSEETEKVLRKQYNKWAEFWKVQYLLEVVDEKENLLYFEKIKF